MRRFAILLGSMILSAGLAGCGYAGGGPKNTTNLNAVSRVTISPNSLSLNAGDTATVSATAVNSGNAGVSTTFTFNSSNTALATVSPQGLICAGVWDSLFITCNGADAAHNPLQGTANITASAQGVSSNPLQVSIHPPIASITVSPIAGCTSVGMTPQTMVNNQLQPMPFTAQAFDANGKAVTLPAGSFGFSLTDPTVGTVDANGVVTARSPGLAGVVATISNVTSPAVPFETCMPLEIRLHLASDPAGGPFSTAVNLNLNDVSLLQADFTDTQGVVTTTAPVTILSNNSTVGVAAGTTLTAIASGGAGLIAACTPPVCGNGINKPVYSNLFQVNVAGISPPASVFATTSAPPPGGINPTMVAINTGINPPQLSASIVLPGVPNSFVFASSGARAFLGTTAGLVAFDPGTNSVTIASAAALGKVLAVSPAGDKAIVSDASLQPDPALQHVFIFNQGASALETHNVPGAVAATFDTDGFRAYIVAGGNNPNDVANGNGNIYVFSPSLSFQTLTPAGGSFTSVASLSSGPFVYLANSAASPGGLLTFSTCDNSQQPAANDPATNSAPQLVGSAQNQNMIVAVDSTGLDVETVSAGSLLNPAAPPTPAAPALTFCPPPVSSTNQHIDFGVGTITARQLLVASNGSHAVVLPAGLPELLVGIPGSATPGTVPLAAGATGPLSGGITPDGNTAWIGVAGTNTVDKINLFINSDAAQVATNFKQADGVTPAAPDLVAVKP